MPLPQKRRKGKRDIKMGRGRGQEIVSNIGLCKFSRILIVGIVQCRVVRIKRE